MRHTRVKEQHNNKNDDRSLAWITSYLSRRASNVSSNVEFNRQCEILHTEFRFKKKKKKKAIDVNTDDTSLALYTEVHHI